MIYTFGDFRVNTAKREVRRGPDLVELEPRSYELLTFLIEHRDKAVSKDALQDGVWGTIVSDSAMTRSVMKLRQSLDDSSGSIIKTVRGYGYRFVAEVESPQEVTQPAAASSPSAPAPAPSGRGSLIPGLLVVAAMIADLSRNVLP